MLTHPLFEQLKTLRCDGMLEAFRACHFKCVSSHNPVLSR